jgi:hypothetical protein
MPLKVLRRREVIAAEGQLMSLNTKGLSLSPEQKAYIRLISEQRLKWFVQKLWVGIWDYRSLDGEPIPDSLRFLVRKATGGGASCAAFRPRKGCRSRSHLCPVLAAEKWSQVNTAVKMRSRGRQKSHATVVALRLRAWQN